MLSSNIKLQKFPLGWVKVIFTSDEKSNPYLVSATSGCWLCKKCWSWKGFELEPQPGTNYLFVKATQQYLLHNQQPFLVLYLPGNVDCQLRVVDQALQDVERVRPGVVRGLNGGVFLATGDPQEAGHGLLEEGTIAALSPGYIWQTLTWSWLKTED